MQDSESEIDIPPSWSANFTLGESEQRILVSDVDNALKRILSIIPKVDFLEAKPRVGLAIRIEALHHIEVLHPAEVIVLADKLDLLSRYEGFSKFLEGFGNPTQFLSSEFEAHCAYHCARLPGCSDFVFSPTVVRHGKRRVPEFRFVVSGIELFAECKRLDFLQLRFKNRIKKIQDTFVALLKENDLPENLRFDLEIRNSFSGNVQGILLEVFLEFSLRGKRSGIYGPFSYAVRERSEEPKFSAGAFYNMTRDASVDPIPTTPTRMDHTTSRCFLAYSPDIESNIGKLMNIAKRQLPPENGRGLIFLKVPERSVAQGQSAVLERFKIREYQSILCAKVVGNETEKLCYRIGNVMAVAKIFGLKPNELISQIPMRDLMRFLMGVWKEKFLSIWKSRGRLGRCINGDPTLP